MKMYLEFNEETDEQPNILATIHGPALFNILVQLDQDLRSINKHGDLTGIGIHNATEVTAGLLAERIRERIREDLTEMQLSL